MSQKRIAVVDLNKCKPKKCNKQCEFSCPVNKMGKLCIEIEGLKQKSLKTCALAPAIYVLKNVLLEQSVL